MRLPRMPQQDRESSRCCSIGKTLSLNLAGPAFEFPRVRDFSFHSLQATLLVGVYVFILGP